MVQNLRMLLLHLQIQWTENKLVEPEFLAYVTENISYPWTMIDKITPRPAQSVIDMLE